MDETGGGGEAEGNGTRRRVAVKVPGVERNSGDGGDWRRERWWGNRAAGDYL
jgi:hypothetical protein